MHVNATIPDVLSQHADQAAFLWILRNEAVRAPQYSIHDLARLDSRIEAHLDGLRVSGDDGWRICVEELKWSEPGEVFAASALAFMSDDISRMQPALEAVRNSPKLARGMISALGFLPHQQVMSRITQLSGSQSPDLRLIGLSASAIQRIDPGTTLTKALESDDAQLRARARRAVGEFGRRDLLPTLRSGLKDEDKSARFWSTWSIGVLGERKMAESLQEFAVAKFDRSGTALDLATRLLDVPLANAWRKSLAANEQTLRLAIVAAGAIGDPEAIPWLIGIMGDKKLGRVAGESFTTITGADLALLDLDVAPSGDSDAGPNDNPTDENVAMDADENLSTPDAKLVQGWWTPHARDFRPGKRYLLGEMITQDSLQKALRCGKQRHRAAAALELMLADPKAAPPLFEVRANGRFQKRQLGIISSK